MKKNSLLSVIFLTLFISCQRETGYELASGLRGDSSLLIKKVDESTEPGQPGKYTGTYDYEYNTENKLIGILFNANYGIRTATGVTRYIRDSKGRIITIENVSKQFINGLPYVSPEGQLPDTSIINIVYQDESSHKISYIKSKYQVGDKTAKDSTVYEYDNNGRVTKTSPYHLPLAVHLPGDTLILGDYSTWTFDASGNLRETILYAKTKGSFIMNIRYRFEYDNKVNPLYTHEDMFLSNWSDYSPHDVIKQNVFIPGTNENYDNTAVYQYRSDNKPASVTYFSPPTVVNATRVSTFYYR